MKKFLGFTLIEVMVVIVILSIMASFIVPKIMSRPDEAKMVKARQDILAIESALDMYRLDNGFYPSTDQGLRALVEKPTSPPLPEKYTPGGYLKKLRLDPWNRPYQYLNPGVHSEIDIFSYGEDGKPGGDQEIGNWHEQQS